MPRWFVFLRVWSVFSLCRNFSRKRKAWRLRTQTPQQETAGFKSHLTHGMRSWASYLKPSENIYLPRLEFELYWLAYKSKSLALWMKPDNCPTSMLSCCFSCPLRPGNEQKTIMDFLVQGVCKGNQRSKEWRYVRTGADLVRTLFVIVCGGDNA